MRPEENPSLVVPLALMLALVVLVVLVGGCGGTGDDERKDAVGTRWDQMRWDDGEWQ